MDIVEHSCRNTTTGQSTSREWNYYWQGFDIVWIGFFWNKERNLLHIFEHHLPWVKEQSQKHIGSKIGAQILRIMLKTKKQLQIDLGLLRYSPDALWFWVKNEDIDNRLELRNFQFSQLSWGFRILLAASRNSISKNIRKSSQSIRKIFWHRIWRKQREQHDKWKLI